MKKLKKWACISSLVGLGSLESGIICGLVKEYKDFPNQVDRVRMFLEDNPDKLQYVFEQTGTNNLQDAATLLYSERISTVCGLFSEVCRNIDLPLEFASLSSSGMVLGAATTAILLGFKTHRMKKKLQKTTSQPLKVQSDELCFEKKN